ncbi:MAG: hypothetical protein OXI81_17490 [Paracoccaceae bacterium]|nr:hypothetical protein [Paracoccaceae bacterium]
MKYLKLDHMRELFEGLLRLRVENFIAFAIVAYFSGWLYVNYFFSEFGINRSSFSFDHYTVFVYFFYVLIKVPEFVLAISPNSFFGAMALIGAVLTSTIRFTTARIPVLDVAQRAVVISLIFGCMFFFSIDAGQRDARSVIDERNARAVSVVFTKEIEEAYAKQFTPLHATFVLCDLAAASDQNALALVWRSSDETLLLRYETTEGADREGPIATYRIPNQFIAVIESKLDNANGSEGLVQRVDCMAKAHKVHSQKDAKEEEDDANQTKERELVDE